MNISNILGWCGIISGLGGMLAWMIFYQLSINYTQKHLTTLCQKIYGNKHFFVGKLGMTEFLLLGSVACAVFINYHFLYKRGKNIKINRKQYPTLTKKNFLFIVQNHYRWLIMNISSLFFGFSWMIFSSLFFYLSKKFT